MPKKTTHNFSTFITKNKNLVILLAVIMLAGFVLRIWDLGSQSLWIDEGYSINAALATIENGYPKLDSGEIYSNSTFHTYITAGMIKVFNLNPTNPWLVRLPSVLFGIAVILLIFVLSNYILENRNLSLIIAALIALSYWEIDWSRQVRGYVGLQFFIFLSVLYFWRWLESKKNKFALFFILSFILAYLNHKLAIVFVPAFGIAYIANQILNTKKIVHLRNIFIAILSVIAIGIITLQSRLFNLELYNFNGPYLRFIFTNFLPIALFTMAGIGLAIFDKKKFWPVMFLAILLLFPMMIIMFYGPAIQMRYLFPLYPLMVMISVYAISRIVELVCRIIPKSRKFSATIIIAAIIFSGQIILKPQSFYQSEFDSPRPDFKNAYGFIKENRKDSDLIISPYAHLNKIYLNDKGYWLPISLSGKQSELKRTIIDGEYDYYVYAPIVKDSNHLNELIENNSGYIVIDGMASFRLRDRLLEITDNPNVTQVFHSGTQLNSIWVYKF